ncbi:alpha/beta hydrolase [Actinospica robiniae]|uniref:alpha/beta hydrolase n=1 Tax=Actinospica robiniae TaxID=304901 RepID=UPI00146FB801|nr:alpha/beta hydrolase [Actinospica robiniae]
MAQTDTGRAGSEAGYARVAADRSYPDPAAPVFDPELVRVARLYRRVDHADAQAVRSEAKRRIQVSRMAGLWRGADPAVTFQDHVVPASDSCAVPVRVYLPITARGPLPVVLYAHGGAFISGDLDFEHPRCLDLCRETGFALVSIDYRLAPEHSYPAALDDCLHVYRRLLDDGGAGLGFETDGRTAVVGASAGGALVAALCQAARDRAWPLPAFQVLLYPVADDRLETASMRACVDTPAWDAPNCAHMWNHYLGPAGARGEVAPYAAPGRATDLAGLPPAYVMTAQYDPLRDEGAAYAAALASAGVRVEYHQFAGAFHGFDTLAGGTLSSRALREAADVLRAAL